jgi:hypothetical protein
MVEMSSPCLRFVASLLRTPMQRSSFQVLRIQRPRAFTDRAEAIHQARNIRNAE